MKKQLLALVLIFSTGSLGVAQQSDKESGRVAAIIVDHVGQAISTGGTVITASGKEKYHIWGWVMILGGAIIESAGNEILKVSRTDEPNEIKIMAGNSEGSLNVPLLLNSLEGDAILVTEGLGNVAILDDISSATGVEPTRFASLVLEAKRIADGISGTTISAEQLNEQIGEDLSGLEKSVVVNYLGLRNIRTL